MAWTITNRGLFTIASTAIGSADLRILILADEDTLPAGALSVDLDTVADLLGVSGVTEAAASGYSRFDLTGVNLSEDDTNDWVTLSWDAPTWEEVAGGERWVAAALYVEGASDAARPLIGIDVFASPLNTNGSDVTYSGAAIRIQRPS